MAAPALPLKACSEMTTWTFCQPDRKPRCDGVMVVIAVTLTSTFTAGATINFTFQLDSCRLR